MFLVEKYLCLLCQSTGGLIFRLKQVVFRLCFLLYQMFIINSLLVINLLILEIMVRNIGFTGSMKACSETTGLIIEFYTVFKLLGITEIRNKIK